LIRLGTLLYDLGGLELSSEERGLEELILSAQGLHNRGVDFHKYVISWHSLHSFNLAFIISNLNN
jgi:hypothetical protein